jgi:hypothetical protein
MSGNGNPGYRIPDGLGHIPRFGEVADYSRRSGLSRMTILAGLRTGRFHVGADGLILPRPPQEPEGLIRPAQEEPLPW